MQSAKMYRKCKNPMIHLTDETLRFFAIVYPRESNKSENTTYCLENSSKNIANFIMSMADSVVTGGIVITDARYNFVLSTIGCLINKCPDQDYLINEIYPAIIPLQWGKEKAGKVKYIEVTEELLKDIEAITLPF